jgi:hypothetical protein
MFIHDAHRTQFLRVTFAWHMRQIHVGYASHQRIRRHKLRDDLPREERATKTVTFTNACVGLTEQSSLHVLHVFMNGYIQLSKRTRPTFTCRLGQVIFIKWMDMNEKYHDLQTGLDSPLILIGVSDMIRPTCISDLQDGPYGVLTSWRLSYGQCSQHCQDNRCSFVSLRPRETWWPIRSQGQNCNLPHPPPLILTTTRPQNRFIVI